VRHGILFALSTLLAVSSARAQDMEPKAYSASPVGVNFLAIVGTRSTGDVLFDPTLPVTDVHADVRGLGAGYGHTFGLFGKLALVTVVLPAARLDATGQVFEEARSVRRSGLADTRVKFSMNLRGNDAMSPREFAQRPRRTVVGASLTVSAPTGQYDGTKLINLGADRWSFKPEIGVSHPMGRWDVDAYLAAGFFTDNPDFFPGGARRTQDPILAVQGHASYSVRPRLWIAADGTWYWGGSSRVNDGEPSIPVRNTRLGVTMSIPIAKSQSFKVAYSKGAIVRTGTNFTTIAIAWQMLWLSRR